MSPTPLEVFADLPSTTVTSGGTDAPAQGTAETWTVASSASFPTVLTGATQFHIADTAPAASTEIIAVTAISGVSWTVTRGADGTTPVAHTAGFTVVQVVTAGVLTALQRPPWQFDVALSGARGNGKVILDATITSGALGTLTSSSAAFTSADTGKTILVDGAAGAGRTLVTTITYVSATSVTLATAATSAVSAVTAVYGSDDTSAINTAKNAAVTWATTGTGATWYAEVVFQPGIYLVAGPPAQGGTTKGNAQIPLPVLPMSGRKLTLVFRGTEESTSNMYGLNTLPLVGGAALVCGRTDGTNSGTYGPASVIGGPTNPQVGRPGPSNTFTNLRAVIKGITLIMPYNSTYAGFDFYGCAAASVPSATVTVLAEPSELGNPNADISNRWPSALRMPSLSNDGNCDIGEYNCSGMWIGVSIGEHVHASSLNIFYCEFGIEGYCDLQGTPMTHASRIDYACVEACYNQLIFDDSLCRLDIACLDMDGGSGGNMVQDPSNVGWGNINWRGAGNELTISGGGRLRLISGDQARGNVGSPTFVLGTALVNPWWRDAFIIISGGTVTGISIDGVATGETSGGFLWPTGQTMTINGSALPTTTVWLL